MVVLICLEFWWYELLQQPCKVRQPRPHSGVHLLHVQRRWGYSPWSGANVSGSNGHHQLEMVGADALRFWQQSWYELRRASLAERLCEEPQQEWTRLEIRLLVCYQFEQNKTREKLQEYLWNCLPLLVSIHSYSPFDTSIRQPRQR